MASAWTNNASFALVIVYEDADLEAAAQGLIAGAFINTGQDCTAATRVYVQRPLWDEFLARVSDLTAEIRVGDPMPATRRTHVLAQELTGLRIEEPHEEDGGGGQG